MTNFEYVSNGVCNSILTVKVEKTGSYGDLRRYHLNRLRQRWDLKLFRRLTCWKDQLRPARMAWAGLCRSSAGLAGGPGLVGSFFSTDVTLLMSEEQDS